MHLLQSLWRANCLRQSDINRLVYTIIHSATKQISVFPEMLNASPRLGNRLLSGISSDKSLLLTCRSSVALSSILQFFFSAPAVRQQVINCDWLPSLSPPPLLCLCYFRWHHTLPSLFTHNICVCSPHIWNVLQTWHKVVWIFWPCVYSLCFKGKPSYSFYWV